MTCCQCDADHRFVIGPKKFCEEHVPRFDGVDDSLDASQL